MLNKTAFNPKKRQIIMKKWGFSIVEIPIKYRDRIREKKIKNKR
jgi:hypothetical protein